MKALDLTPAKWIWFSSRRTLPNTFVLFRRELHLRQQPLRATGWIGADSRYKLELNAQRVQFGPAPADPRFLEADPIDFTDLLEVGQNVIAATVLFYGHGDGTSPLGKPGFVFSLELEFPDGSRERVVSDESWQTHLARAWRPGQYKRWYLRALQEDFDARIFPHGWNARGFVTDQSWLPAMVLECAANKSPITTNYRDDLNDLWTGDIPSSLGERSIPMLEERLVPATNLAESYALEWRVPPEDYFDFHMPDDVLTASPVAVGQQDDGAITLNLEPTQCLALTFEFAEQLVGWPIIELEAAAGTVIELMVHEAHELGGPVLLNTHFHAWSRHTCKDGWNHLEPFDFESFRWLQVMVRNANGPVKIHRLAARRRSYPFAPVTLEVSEPGLQRLFSATLNTVLNSAQETFVDGMGRERQQYSGDCGHQLHVTHLAFGDQQLTRRFLETYSSGQTIHGYFLDCWPASDRLQRVAQREVGLSDWGPILDHGVGFVMDAWQHLLYCDDPETLAVLLPKFKRQLEYFQSIIRDDLLPVENIGVPMVWIDHEAYLLQRHKECAFNLYTIAMLEHALAPMAKTLQDASTENIALEFAQRLHHAVIQKYWDDDAGIFVANKPWLETESGPRLCDRSLATAILYNLCPNGRTQAAMDVLEACPAHLGLSYPPNAVWRLQALCKAGRTQTVLNELRTRWANLESVRLNNTLGEFWTLRPDSHAQWSHCPVAPIVVLYSGIAGITALEPGFKRAQIRPQLLDLGHLKLSVPTVRGPIHFHARGDPHGHDLTLEIPERIQAELVVPVNTKLPLEWLRFENNLEHYQLPSGQTTLRLTTQNP
jgi:alpha-L-rhamnosidase